MVLVLCVWMLSLNPCFNGRYSQSTLTLYNNEKETVLILVLMEDTLRVGAYKTIAMSLGS